MPEDYYPQEEQSGVGRLPPEDSEPESGDSETALLPKAMLGDAAPGDTLTLTVVHVYEDEIEVKKTEPETEKPNRPTYEGELDDLAEMS